MSITGREHAASLLHLLPGANAATASPMEAVRRVQTRCPCTLCRNAGLMTISAALLVHGKKNEHRLWKLFPGTSCTALVILSEGHGWGSCGTQTLAGRIRDERAATQNRISQHTAPGTALRTPTRGKWRPDRLSIQAVL